MPAVDPEIDSVSYLATGSGSLDLSTVRGPAVVNVWASWCKPCRQELPLYQSFAVAHSGTVKVLGIDFQDPRTDAARQLVSATGVRYPLYADPSGRMRARALPQVIFVDAQGRITHEEYVEIKTSDQLEKLAATHLGTGS